MEGETEAVRLRVDADDDADDNDDETDDDDAADDDEEEDDDEEDLGGEGRDRLVCVAVGSGGGTRLGVGAVSC